jgi:oxygen-dependent protoporphyrinogen oxidase
MARRFGESFAREWLPALVAGVFAAPPRLIGLDALPALKLLETQGGLLLGSLRAGHPRTRQPVGGTGALAQHLATQIGCVRLNHPARIIEFLPDRRWRIQSDDASTDVDELVLALPPKACATLLRPTLPSAAHRYESLPMLDLRIWHSRHALVPSWKRGFNLLLHPPDGKGLLGIIGQPAADPRGVPGLLQVRSFLGGAYALDPALEAWPGVAAELQHWLPELSEAIQVREASCPSAFPLLEPDHGTRIASVLAGLPPKLHWIGAARFGPGVANLAEGVQTWAKSCPISSIPVPAPMAG